MQLAEALLRPARTGQVRRPAVPVEAMRDLGELLRLRRERLGLRQQDAARQVPVSHRLWCEVENFKRHEVGAATLLRMLRSVGIRVQLVLEAVPDA